MFCSGWESQLLETGFLAIFLCPVWTLSQVPRNCPPSLICIWTFRWLIVRIMLGAVSITVYKYMQCILQRSRVEWKVMMRPNENQAQKCT